MYLCFIIFFFSPPSLFFCSYVEHRAFVKLLPLVLSKARPFASFQLIPSFSGSLYVVFSQVVLCLPFFLVPGGYQSSACLFIASCGLRNVWLIHHHFLSFICCSIGICFVLCHNSSFGILSSHLICRRHQFTYT
jgi:hypothetical protein